ncbi:MAG: sodium-dependent transporter [Muribaculum sp.]|nr:sodium-dependent transporter [Muribaculaceae bacterium]MCM1080591.1 sodium-dependent transporter [Muribaculum sp.]
MSAKNQFGSKIGLIAATVGSAVGLGNIWRFPAEAQENGGAAFLLLYVACVFILGIPVMIGEFSLGRGTRENAADAFSKLSPRSKWWIVGATAILASYLILSFYMVVAGWTLEYMIQSLTGDLYAHVKTSASTQSLDALFAGKMKQYIGTDLSPLLATYCMLIINLIILLRGVQKGIERMSNILMPVLFSLLLIFACKALSFSNAMEGLEFFFSPDFSKITSDVAINALGQAFFSLSLGMGILITYSSYFPKSTKLGRTAITISLLDLLVAILMGVIIFPAVMSFGLADHNLAGATLVFITLPEVFAQMNFSVFWSTIFFLLLTVAALTSTISLAEVSTAFIKDKLNVSRKKACFIVILPLFGLSTLCSLSQGSLSDFTLAGMNLFTFLDTVATNYMLPISALLTCLYLGWKAPKNLLKNEITNGGTSGRFTYKSVRFILSFLAPILIALILISNFL